MSHVYTNVPVIKCEGCNVTSHFVEIHRSKGYTVFCHNLIKGRSTIKLFRHDFDMFKLKLLKQSLDVKSTLQLN